MNSLDLRSFLYAVVYCVGWEGEREGFSIPPLPPSLSPVVTSTVQEAWWSVASKAMAGTMQLRQETGDLSAAITAFLQLCFVFNLTYPKVNFYLLYLY